MSTSGARYATRHNVHLLMAEPAPLYSHIGVPAAEPAMSGRPRHHAQRKRPGKLTAHACVLAVTK